MLKFYILLIMILVNSSIYAQLNRSDKGYKYFSEKKYNEAINYWESKISSEDENYKLKAKFLIALSHKKLASLYLLASFTVPKIESIYYNLLLKKSNVNKSLLHLYNSLTLAETGKYKSALGELKKVKKSKVGPQHRELIRIVAKYLLYRISNKKNNNSPYYLNLLNSVFNANELNIYKNKNLMKFQKLKIEFIQHILKKNKKQIFKIYSTIERNSINYNDVSKSGREIRFYDPNIYSLLTYYHLVNAEKYFMSVNQSANPKILKSADKQLAAIYFLLNKQEYLKKLSIKYPDDEVIKAYAVLTNIFYSNGTPDKIERIIKKPRLRAKMGYYLCMFNVYQKRGISLIDNAFKQNSSSEIKYYEGFALSLQNKAEEVNKAEEILSTIYTKSWTTDFKKNSPEEALLYSYCLFKKSPQNSCPESIGIGWLLAGTYKPFMQYHNALQGICLFYSTLGNGDIKLQ